MSKKVIIYDGVEDDASLAEQLRHIANLIDEGYTIGYTPAWEIVEDDDDDEE
jgi:hypothetical protein